MSPPMTDTAELIARLHTAMELLAAEDGRQAKLHDLLETIREQIRLEVAPEHRPVALFTNIQNAVYAMRGRTPLLNDAAIAETLREAVAALSSLVRERDEARTERDNLIAWFDGLTPNEMHDSIVKLRELVVVAEDEVARLSTLVDQAFRDGVIYGTNIADADPNIAWEYSRARASLSNTSEGGDRNGD